MTNLLTGVTLGQRSTTTPIVWRARGPREGHLNAEPQLPSPPTHRPGVAIPTEVENVRRPVERFCALVLSPMAGVDTVDITRQEAAFQSGLVLRGDVGIAAHNFRNARLLTALLIVPVLLVAPALAAEKPRVNISTRTIHMPVVQKITFARHNTVSLTDDEIDVRLASATLIFQTKSAVVCPVKFVRKNSQVIFSEIGFDQVTSSGDFNAINSAPALQGIRVKSILTLSWCDGPSPDAIGCGSEPGDFIIVQNDGLNDWEGIDLAHEFGHNQGLKHTPNDEDPSNDPTRIMFGGFNDAPTNVTAEECRAFQKPVSF